MKGERTDLKEKVREPGRHWLRITVGWDGDVLLDNVVISNVRYLGNYLFTDEELALFHQTRNNGEADNVA